MAKHAKGHPRPPEPDMADLDKGTFSGTLPT